jgi:hypothetical protein
VDILRCVWWNLEQLNGRNVYTYDTFFWQKVGCLLDNFCCLKSAANKGNLMLLSRSINISKDKDRFSDCCFNKVFSTK